MSVCRWIFFPAVYLNHTGVFDEKCLQPHHTNANAQKYVKPLDGGK